MLQDRTGTIEGKVWDYSGPVSPANIGAVIKIRGTVSEFRGMPQMTIDRIRLAEDGDQVRTNNLVPTASIDVEASYCLIEALVDSIEDEDYAAICRKMLAK